MRAVPVLRELSIHRLSLNRAGSFTGQGRAIRIRLRASYMCHQAGRGRHESCCRISAGGRAAVRCCDYTMDG